ncbi:MAG TPA: universal stress protein [Anaerolineales bacterium]|nr:universal stress protein [Anaerolineales bacterium]
MAHVSHKLKNSIEGALAGGGDPATSPLYVFGPFLKLIVVAGVAQITFGASLWLVVITIAVVSAMYRLVMQWVTDGSGGSGLSEEEFGGWAVKINAAITFIEYTLTFLVSMAAMVTFIADRMPVLNNSIGGLEFLSYRTLTAILLSVFTGWLVNRGPKMAARAFGPATAAVLMLLWAMVIASIVKHGFHLPDFNLDAFRPEYFHITLGGYVRILAVMTGVEVFANLVAAYDGTPKQKSNKAFYSLLIIMGTTAVTMLIVGPVIFDVSDPLNAEVSVFTQTMDHLLPQPLPYIGTLVGIAVLMSASAASAQGLQNLALGLKERRYLPPVMGEPNQYGVAEKPVWLEVGIVSICFLFFGTHEETYLAIYAAGVFILLSMTGWAVTKRLVRMVREKFSVATALLIFGTVAASILTTGATLIIFEERFFEGAWTYFLFIPVIYAGFTYFRNRMGAPNAEMDYLGLLDTAQLGGFGFGQMAAEPEDGNGNGSVEISWQPDPKEQSTWRIEKATISNIAVLLDGSDPAAQALPIAKAVARATKSNLTLLSSVKDRTKAQKEAYKATVRTRKKYLNKVAKVLTEEGFNVSVVVRPGRVAEATKNYIAENGIDFVVTATRGKSGKPHWVSGGVSRKLVQAIDLPILLVKYREEGYVPNPRFKRIQVALDGSIYSERTLPYARLFAKAFKSELLLMNVPAVPEVKDYRAASEVVEQIRKKAETNIQKFLSAVARSLRKDRIKVHTIVKGSIPTRMILEVSEKEKADMIMLTSRGRGALDLLLMGSVAEEVVDQTTLPVLMMPVRDRNKG